MGGVEIPDYHDGQNMFSNDFTGREYVIGARDRCDYTIDRIRTVRSDRYRYIRNYFPDRPMMQADYRDNKPIVKDIKQAFKDGILTDYQAEHWFGTRLEEELYDLEADPHQMNNLAANPEFESALLEHQDVLENWIKQTGDLSQEPESTTQLKATVDLWKDRPRFKNSKVNPEYDQFKD